MDNSPLESSPGGARPVADLVAMPFAPVHVALYIDADNQASQNARVLVSWLRDGFGIRIVRATVAGNGKGKVTAGWVDVLREEIPDLPITEITVPCRKDAADAALIMALGADLADHLRAGARVVVVSRDATRCCMPQPSVSRRPAALSVWPMRTARSPRRVTHRLRHCCCPRFQGGLRHRNARRLPRRCHELSHRAVPVPLTLWRGSVPCASYNLEVGTWPLTWATR